MNMKLNINGKIEKGLVFINDYILSDLRYMSFGYDFYTLWAVKYD